MIKRSLLALLITAFISACGPGEESSQKRTANRIANTASFVKNTACAECHQKQYQEWSGSHHDLAMQVAAEKTVLADFSNSSFTHLGVTSRFFKKDGKFVINTDGPDGKLADFEIKYTFGVEPLQQYLVELPGGRLQALSVAWDTEKKRWFHLYPDEKISHNDPLHWTGLYQNVNSMCAECHTTNFKKGFEPKAETYKTTWSEINVSCQACHGPGEQHVRWAKESKNAKWAKYADKRLLVDIKAPGRQVEACARCHSRRHSIGEGFKHGTPFMDNYVPALLREGLYHADGQILDEVYVYGSFVQSRMYRAGVRCTDCHNPHNAKTVKAGNDLCVQCHRPTENERFRNLQPKDYDSTEHHFHKTGSAGAKCVNCHMPAKMYMVVDPRRDHSFRVPRPDLTVKLGTPNACNMCHMDRSTQWAAKTVAQWYGTRQSEKPHYAEIIAAGRKREKAAESLLVELSGDMKQPTIVRATALELLRSYGAKALEAVKRGMKDRDPLVRTAAVRSMEHFGPELKLETVAPLLNDPIRAVRMGAVRALASVPRDMLDQTQRAKFDKSLEEFKEAQMAMADQPSTHLNQGVMVAGMGRRDLAEQSYLKALRMDPRFLPARFNLANLYNAMGRNAEAERVLRDGIKQAPDEGELYYSLGLLLAEEKRYPEAASNLGRAAKLMPKRPRVHYNHGLTLQHLGRRSGAEIALLKAHRLTGSDASILQALSIFYMQGRQWDRATTYAERLTLLYPNEPGSRRLLNQIREMKKQSSRITENK